MSESDEELTEVEVFLVPVGEDVVLAMPTGSELAADDSSPGFLHELFRSASPLLAAALGHPSGAAGAPSGGVLFEMSPESLAQYDAARLDDVGSYFRGVLRTAEGRASHQVQLREVQRTELPTSIDPAHALQLMQLAAIQAQLNRIEDTLSVISTAITGVMRFLEIQQRSLIESSLTVLREVHDRARRTAAISDIDWGRVSRAEIDLGSQLTAIRIELHQKLQSTRFTGVPKHDAEMIRALDPSRVEELVRAHRLLTGGLRGWNELLVLRKHLDGTLTLTEVEDVHSRIERLRLQQEELDSALDAVTHPSRLAVARSWPRRLLSDGIILGERNDRTHLREIEAGRSLLERVQEDARSAVSPPAKLQILGTAASPGLRRNARTAPADG